MTYILMIWTVVAMAGDRHYQNKAMDWRPIGEFYDFSAGSGQAKCEEAARQLGLKIENYRCVRSK
jgi:hypothetical protein